MSRSHTKKGLKTIAQEKAPGVGRHREQIYFIQLPVPVQAPSIVDSSQLLFMSYCIRVSAIIRLKNNPFVEIPIGIENAVQETIWREFRSTGNERSAAQLATERVHIEAIAPSFDELAEPPTYEESLAAATTALHLNANRKQDCD